MKIILLLVLVYFLVLEIFRILKAEKTKIVELNDIEMTKISKKMIAYIIVSLVFTIFIVYINGFKKAYFNEFNLLFFGLFNLLFGLKNILSSFRRLSICEDFIQINNLHIPYKKVAEYEWDEIGELNKKSVNHFILKIKLKENDNRKVDFRTKVLIKLGLITFETAVFTFIVDKSNREKVDKHLCDKIV